MSELVKSKKISSRQLVEFHIQQIEKVNPTLNAVVENRYVEALKEADQVDQKISKGQFQNSPFLGVPFTVKEMYAIPGMKRTGGSYFDKDKISKESSTVVTRLQKAGAIPIATTNVSELGFWYECDNPVYGRGRNPYDPDRTCGGSSGGEGSIIGAGASPFGVGSDIGGSVRIPAAFCGVFGHKPTNRAMPLTGHHPFDQNDFKTKKDPNYPVTSAGILSKSAKDLPFLFEQMVGPDQIDQETFDSSRLAKAAARPSKVLILEEPNFTEAPFPENEMVRSVQRAADFFEKQKIPTLHLRTDLFKNAFELWSLLVEETENESFEESAHPHHKVSVLNEMWRLPFDGLRRFTFPSLATILLERVSNKFIKKNQLYKEELQKIRNELNLQLGEGGILITPVHPRVAPYHQQTYFSPFNFIYTGIYNALGNPATSVPMGLNNEGLPLSVQIVGNHFEDRNCIQAAQGLEKEFGGWVPPNWI